MSHRMVIRASFDRVDRWRVSQIKLQRWHPFCDDVETVPRRIVLDIDDTEDRAYGGQQLALFNAHHDSQCFMPIHIYEVTTGKPGAIFLRPGKTPDGTEMALVPARRYSAGPSVIRLPALPRLLVQAALTLLDLTAIYDQVTLSDLETSCF